MLHDITIKMVETKKYSVTLIEAANYKYYVRFEDLNTESVVWTAPITDLSIASYLFDKKLSDLNIH